MASLNEPSFPRPAQALAARDGIISQPWFRFLRDWERRHREKINQIQTASNAYTRNATVVEDRTLLASASATATNNNNVLAALIADLQAAGIIG